MYYQATSRQKISNTLRKFFSNDDTKIYNSFNDFQKDKTNLHNQIERVVAMFREG